MIIRYFTSILKKALFNRPQSTVHSQLN